MKAKELERLIAAHSHFSTSDLVARFQHIRQVGVLPTKRGVHAPDVTVEQIAHALLGIAPERVVDAGRGAVELSGYEAAETRKKAFANGVNLFEAMQTILGNAGVAAVCKVEVCHPMGFARLHYREGDADKVCHYLDPTGDRFEIVREGIRKNPEAFAGASLYRPTIYPSNFLQLVALEFAALDESAAGYAS